MLNEYHNISPEDLDLFKITDDVNEAVDLMHASHQESLRKRKTSQTGS